MGEVKIGDSKWQDITAVELKCHYCDVTSKQDVLTAVWSDKEGKTVLICRNHNPFKEGTTVMMDALTGFPVFISSGEKLLE